MTQTIEIKVPDIGDYSDLPIIEVLVSVGEFVKTDQALVTLESDKATIDVPCPESGVVQALKVKAGDRISKGTVLLFLTREDLVENTCRDESENFDKFNSHKEINATRADMDRADGSKELLSQSQLESRFVEIFLPDIGEVDVLPVVEIFVKVGQRIKFDEPILSLESDKATIDIPSVHNGIVQKINIKVGEQVGKGTSIAVFEIENPDSSNVIKNIELKSGDQLDKPRSSVPMGIEASNLSNKRVVHAGPSVRKLARELDVDITQVEGSGLRKRILYEDLQSYVKKNSLLSSTVGDQNMGDVQKSNFPTILPWPQVDFQKFGPCRRESLSRIKNISGANLHRNWVSIPHVSAHDDVDVTDLEAFRMSQNKRLALLGENVKLTTLAFLMKAVVIALKQFPILNSSLDGKEIVLKEYFNIGFAADTESGLVVPVLRDVDKKGVMQIAKEVVELAKLARNAQLKIEDMQGGCFSISSLGGIGGRYFTPIINAPEVAILGVGRGDYRPVYINGELKKRFMLPLSLSYDHRVIDGATATRFSRYLGELLFDFRICLL